jgi:hypothetical protein
VSCAKWRWQPVLRSKCACAKKKISFPFFALVAAGSAAWSAGDPAGGRRSGDAPPKRTHGRVLDWASFVGRNEISLSVFFWTVFRF